MPEWAQSIRQTFQWLRRRRFQAIVYATIAVLFTLFWHKIDDLPEIIRFTVSGFFPYREVPRESISWNNMGSPTPTGAYEQPSDPAEPLKLTAFRASWSHRSSFSEPLPADMTIFPRLTYAMSGDFDVTTRVSVSGEPTVSGGVRMAGIGALSRKNNIMLLLGYALTPKGQDVRSFLQDIKPTSEAAPFLGQTGACNADTVHLKISKHKQFLGLYCRSDSSGWRPVRADGGFLNVIGEDVSEIFLFAYAADSRPIDATFTNFSFRKR